MWSQTAPKLAESEYQRFKSLLEVKEAYAKIRSSAEKINDYLRKIEHEIDQDAGSLSTIEKSSELAIKELGKIDKYTERQKKWLEIINQQSQPR